MKSHFLAVSFLVLSASVSVALADSVVPVSTGVESLPASELQSTTVVQLVPMPMPLIPLANLIYSKDIGSVKRFAVLPCVYFMSRVLLPRGPF